MTMPGSATPSGASPVLKPDEITAKGEAVQALLCNFPFPPSAPASWSAQAGEHTRRWVDATGLVRSQTSATHFERIDTGRLTGWVHPEALPDRRDTIADWFSWLFIFDDQCDEGTAGRDPALLSGTVRAVEAVLDGSCPDAAGPLPAAMADVCARIRAAAPAAWWQRFSWHVREYLHACLREAANRARGQTPAPAEYPRGRREGGAILPCLDVAEFAVSRYLDDNLYWLPAYQAAREAAADIICWTDDLATVAKEHARGDVHNLVIVLAEHHGLTWAQATTQASGLLHRRIADYLATEQAILQSQPPQAIDTNLRSLRHWMRGHLDWGVETSRYREVSRAPGNPAYVEDLTHP
jgi:hypothetical protein